MWGGSPIGEGPIGYSGEAQEGPSIEAITAAVAGTGGLTIAGTGAINATVVALGTISAAVAGTGGLTIAGTGAVNATVSELATSNITVAGTGGLTIAGTGAAYVTVVALAAINASVAGTGSLTIAGIGAATATIIPQVMKTVTLTLTTDGLTPAAGLSNLRWAWFDAATPDQMGAPTDKGALESTDAAAQLVLQIPNSNFSSGQVGWLTITNSNGSPTQVPAASAFSGPVAID